MEIITACLELTNQIEPSDFNIVVTGTNPKPDEFRGSNIPVDVSLGAGDYEL